MSHRVHRNALIHDQVLQGHVSLALEALVVPTLEAATVVAGYDVTAVRHARVGVKVRARVLKAGFIVES